MMIPYVSSVLLFAAWSATTSPVNAQDFVERCADCWCIPDGGVTADNCPEHGVGIIDDGLDTTTLARYASFQLTSDPIKLMSPDGGDACFPFKDIVGDQVDTEGYPQADAPQCVLPESMGPDTVCAYTVDCGSLDYEMMSYESEAAATAAGASVTHVGACGVCSNAFDFTKLADPDINLSDIGINCGISYSLGQSWEGLIDCYKREVGFSDECGLLWAHYTATNLELCGLECGAVDESGTVPFNLDPPTCEYAPCIECSDSSFQPVMDIMQGRTNHGSGITEEIARPCDIFTPVVHDICPGAAPVTSSPTGMPTSTGMRSGGGAVAFIIMISGAFFLRWL